MTLVLLDTNLLLLLIVGRTDGAYLAAHKRTDQYDAVDLAVVEAFIAAYDGVVTSPHILTEASNLLRQIRNPARDRIQETFRDFILASDERSMPSAEACLREGFVALGLTDAVILAIGEAASHGDDRIELLTTDAPIYRRALSIGLPAELYA